MVAVLSLITYITTTQQNLPKAHVKINGLAVTTDYNLKLIDHADNKQVSNKTAHAADRLPH